MIKIAFIIDTINLPAGGTEKQLLLLMKNIDRERFHPYLCVLRSSEWLKKEFAHLPVYILGIDSFKHPNTYYRIWKYSEFLKRERIDIIQTHFRDSNLAGILAARMAGTRVVISTRRNQGYWHNHKEIMIQKFLNRWVTLFIANSYSTKRWAEEVEAISENRIYVVYNGIDLEPYKRITVETKERYRRLIGITDSSPVVGIVANLRPVKGIDVFLKAAAIVKKEIPGARFIIVGDGMEKENLMGLCNELSLDGSVRFLGKKEDVVSILGALDIGVLSSHSESLSNSIIEYLAAGLPIVSTDVGGGREAIEEGVNGFIVPVGDFKAMAERIIKIIKGGKSYLIGIENRKRAGEKFSLVNTINEYEKIYEYSAGMERNDTSRDVKTCT